LGIITIWDEIITGGRWPKYCVANDWGMHPDLLCVGKAIGNGYPISAVLGSKKLLDNPGYFISNTHNCSQSACSAALQYFETIKPSTLVDLWERGHEYLVKFEELCGPVTAIGYPTRWVWKGSELDIAKYCQEMCKRGWLMHKVFFLNLQHTDDLMNAFIADSAEVMEDMRQGYVKLTGLKPRPVFKR
jgi:glutamate-1-semialdehyde 2,1-aminomutase